MYVVRAKLRRYVIRLPSTDFVSSRLVTMQTDSGGLGPAGNLALQGFFAVPARPLSGSIRTSRIDRPTPHHSLSPSSSLKYGNDERPFSWRPRDRAIFVLTAVESVPEVAVVGK